MTATLKVGSGMCDFYMCSPAMLQPTLLAGKRKTSSGTALIIPS